MKIKTKQYYRALVGTLFLLMLFYLGGTLWVSQEGFLKWVGFFNYSFIFLIDLYINYKFIKWDDKEMEMEKRGKNRK